MTEAIENFNDEVVEFLPVAGLDCFSSPTRRRPKNSVYEYNLAATKSVGFEENQVSGDLVLMEKNMPREDAKLLEIDFDLDVKDVVSSARYELKYNMDLPAEAVVRQLSVYFIDYDEELAECYDELL